MGLIEGQRFKGCVNAGWGTILCRNDSHRANRTIEAYNVQFDHGKVFIGWWRCHVESTEPKIKTIIRRLLKRVFK
mgnify:CR=1 FL=1